MSEPRLCCNCLHCARWRKKDGIECHCDLNDKYLGYLTVMDEENDCKHWEKETKWDLQREHDKQIRTNAIDEYLEKIKKYEDMLGCVMICQCEAIAEQLKEKKDDLHRV